jgi:hypothetical protein
MRRIRETSVAVEKQQVLHVLSVCVCVALVIQHAKRMRRIVLPVVYWLHRVFPHNSEKKTQI